MHIALHLPRPCLQAQLRHQPQWSLEPVALLDHSPSSRSLSASASSSGTTGDRKPRIVEATDEALCRGVEFGMSAPRGQARCAGLRLLHRSPEDESAVQNLLLEAAASLSADFESTAPGLVTVDLGTSPVAHCQNRQRHLGDELVSHFANQHLEAHVGFAPNPDLAALAARCARPVRIFHGCAQDIREQLTPLPLGLADPPASIAGTLQLWGIDTLGDLTALPRHDLAERLGPEAGELWDRAAGKCRRLLRLVRPSVDFSHEADPGHEIATLEPLLFLLRRSLEILSARLAAHWLVSSQLTLTLYFSPPARAELDENAAAAAKAQPYERVFRIPEPTRDVDLLLRMLHTRLENFTIRHPIAGYRLEALPARAGTDSFHLFESTLRDPNRFADTLARLEALLGGDRAGSPVPANSHRPDSFSVQPFSAHGAPSATACATSSASSSPPPSGITADLSPQLLRQPSIDRLSLPLRRYRPPIPLHLRTCRDQRNGLPCPEEILTGQLRGRLCERAGPWKFSGDWWDRECWQRSEWDIQLEDDSLYRIACIGETWYLEGVYG